MSLNPSPDAKAPPPGDYGTCEHCGGEADEFGVSKTMAEAEEQANVEQPDMTDQHVKGDEMHAAAFVDAVKKRRG